LNLFDTYSFEHFIRFGTILGSKNRAIVQLRRFDQQQQVYFEHYVNTRNNAGSTTTITTMATKMATATITTKATMGK
jgi:hypothetical protein